MGIDDTGEGEVCLCKGCQFLVSSTLRTSPYVNSRTRNLEDINLAAQRHMPFSVDICSFSLTHYLRHTGAPIGGCMSELIIGQLAVVFESDNLP